MLAKCNSFNVAQAGKAQIIEHFQETKVSSNSFSGIAGVLLCGMIAGTAPGTSLAAEEGSSWTDKMTWSGDFRLRQEGIDEEGSEDRNRARFRTRFGFSADVSDDIKFVLRLATGGGDPTSTNQSFDDGFSTKDIGVDMAYIDWSASDNVNVLAGKMKNPLFMPGKTGLVWDSDLTPEGFAVKYSSGMFFANAVNWIVEERSSQDDSMIRGVQGGLKFDLGAGKLTTGLSYFDYTDTIGFEPFYDGSPKGNTVDENGDLVYDYNELEVFAQFDTKIGDWPLTVYGDWVQNQEVSIEDTAYTLGFVLGAAKEQGEYQFGLSYQDVEADAVIGTYADSDFGGGGTDVSGLMFKGQYALRKNVTLGLTLIDAEADEFAGNEHDYMRYQLDIEFKF